MKQTHCKRGHELTPANTIQKKDGRNCRLCRNMAERKRYAEKKLGIPATYIPRLSPEEKARRNRLKWKRRYLKIKNDPHLYAEFLAKVRERDKRKRRENPEKMRAKDRRNHRRQKPGAQDHSNRLYITAMRTVPRHYPDEVRNEIVSTVMLAVLEGKLRQRDIGKHVKEYATKHYREYDQFKSVSLDATVPGTDDLRLIDTLADDTFHF